MYSSMHLSVLIVFFFFSSRRRHTRFKCDWSSDVCSSDLDQHPPIGERRLMDHVGQRVHRRRRNEIGRAAGRGRGEISGGAGSLKKKKKKRNSKSDRCSARCMNARSAESVTA